MDTLPLPSSPRLDHYRKRAKELVRAARSSDASAVRAWAADWLRALAMNLDIAITPFVQHSLDRAVEHMVDRVERARRGGDLSLGDAQHLMAEAHGFDSWAAFARHVDDAAGRTPRSTFEHAADAVVTGDIETLSALLEAEPALVRARSERVHRATLLHYVAANGVEDFRQRTPANAVDVARLLLVRGAAVDALAATYGGGTVQTTMNLLVSSAHPAEAGLQSALVDVLLDYGAAIDGVANDESPLLTALAFGYRDAAETLAARGARIDAAITAAAVGRLDLVRRFVVDAATLAPGVRLVSMPWFVWPSDPVSHIQLALVWACRFGREEVAMYLLDAGVAARAHDSDHMTALHWAAASGLGAVVERLVRLGADLEALNDWQGTVLGSTIHFALQSPQRGVDYPSMIELLIAAGANAEAVYPTGDATLDALLRRHDAG